MPFPVVPVPSTWSSGRIRATQMRADAAAAVAFLSARPLFIGGQTSGVAVASGGDAAIPLPFELADTRNGHLPPNSGYFCQAHGWYLVQGTAPFQYSSATQAAFAAGLQGVSGNVAFGPVRGPLEVYGAGQASPSPQVCDLIQLSQISAPGGGGDWVELTGLQTSGGSLNYAATGTKYPRLSVRWVAALSGSAPLIVPTNDAWPVPPSFITSAFLNKNLRDAIDQLIYPPIYRAHYVAGSSSLPNQAFPAGTVVAMTTEDVDNYSAGTTGAGSKYVAPVAGIYFIYGQINLAGTTGTSVAYSAGLSVNGGTTMWGSSVFQLSSSAATGAGACVRKRLRLAAGDTVQFLAQQSSGAALGYNASAANQTRFIALWEGA